MRLGFLKGIAAVGLAALTLGSVAGSASFADSQAGDRRAGQSVYHLDAGIAHCKASRRATCDNNLHGQVVKGLHGGLHGLRTQDRSQCG